ncbi:unnamed protein product [Brassica oleracea var. botrytis]
MRHFTRQMSDYFVHGSIASVFNAYWWSSHTKEGCLNLEQHKWRS